LGASVAKAARVKIQGPSDRGWIASISPPSAASRSVLVKTLSSLAASVRVEPGFDAIGRRLEHRNAVILRPFDLVALFGAHG
jgi:hypothetical protein